MTRKMYLSSSPGGWDDIFGSWSDNESKSLSPYGKAVLYNWFKGNDWENNDEYQSYIDNGYESLPEDWRVALKWTDEWYRQNPDVSYKDYLDQVMKANSLYWDRWETTPEGKFAISTGKSPRRDPSNLQYPYEPVEDERGPLVGLIPEEYPLLPWEENNPYPSQAGPWDPKDFGTYEEEESPEIYQEYFDVRDVQEEHPEWTYDGVYKELRRQYPELTHDEADGMVKRRLNSL